MLAQLAGLSDFLNDTLVKTILAILGGLILKRWAPLVNKSIPLVLLVLSAIVSTLKVLFPALPPDASSAAFTLASFAGYGFRVASNPATRSASWLWTTLAPVAFAIATHSGLKNTWQWREVGAGLFWPGGRPRQ